MKQWYALYVLLCSFSDHLQSWIEFDEKLFWKHSDHNVFIAFLPHTSKSELGNLYLFHKKTAEYVNIHTNQIETPVTL